MEYTLDVHFINSYLIGLWKSFIIDEIIKQSYFTESKAHRDPLSPPSPSLPEWKVLITEVNLYCINFYN